MGCKWPSYRQQKNLLADAYVRRPRARVNRAGPRPHLLYPLFSPVKTSVHSDLLFPSITNDYYTEIGRDPLWEQKKYNQVLWRGETTGAYHAKGTGWRQTQRARLVQREHSTRFRFRAAWR